MIRPTNIHRKAFSTTISHNLTIDFFNHQDFYSNIPLNTVNIYTDGSKIGSTTSAAYIIYHNGSPIAGKINMEHNNSVFQAEAIAIYQSLTLHFVSDSPHLVPQIINIFTDSQTVLKCIAKPKVRSSTIHSLINALNSLGAHHNINLYWVPGHRGIKGNEEADFLARTSPELLASYDNITYSAVTIQPPISYIKKRLRILETIATKNQINRSTSSNQLKSLIHLLTNSKTLPKLFKHLDTSSLRLLSHVLTGHSHLNAFKSKLDTNISPICSLCTIEPETSYHFLCSCPYYSQLRLEIFGDRLVDINTLYHTSVPKLLKFILNSGRFADFC